jgi:predicted DNA-binding ribbon-helix-helix protein
MKSPVVQRSIVVNGHKTSVSLEDQFWVALNEIAAERRLTVSELASIIDHDRGGYGNLSSAIRQFVLARYRSATAAGSQQLPGHRGEKGETP